MSTNNANRDAAKRRGIQGAARQLHKEALRVNPNATLEQSQRRVRAGVVACEKKKQG